MNDSDSPPARTGSPRSRERHQSDFMGSMSEELEQLSVGLTDLFDDLRHTINATGRALPSLGEPQLPKGEGIRPTEFAFDLDATPTGDGLASVMDGRMDLLDLFIAGFEEDPLPAVSAPPAQPVEQHITVHIAHDDEKEEEARPPQPPQPIVLVVPQAPAGGGADASTAEDAVADARPMAVPPQAVRPPAPAYGANLPPAPPTPKPSAPEQPPQAVFVMPSAAASSNLLETFNRLFQSRPEDVRLDAHLVVTDAGENSAASLPPGRPPQPPAYPRPGYPGTPGHVGPPSGAYAAPAGVPVEEVSSTTPLQFPGAAPAAAGGGRRDAHTFTTAVIHAGEAPTELEEPISGELEAMAEENEVETGRTAFEGLEPPNVEPPEGYELLDSYWVNPPHCSVAVLRRSDGQEMLYYLVEPVLDEFAQGLFTKLNEHLRDVLARGKISIDQDRSNMLDANTEKLLRIYGIDVDEQTLDKLRYYLHRDFIGYGKIDGFMHDMDIEDISCDGVEIPIFLYHRRYQNIATNVKFGEDELDIIVVKLAQKCGKHVSIGSPITQATLPDGSRLEATLGREVTTRGSSFTIRRFRAEPFTPVDLVKYGTYSIDMLAYMWLIIENNMNFIIAGGTASGKTSTLNALSIFIPPSSKIVSIEDTRELTLYHQNWVAKVTRESVKGSAEGQIGMFELLRSALRERPEYILVGEVRGPEAQVLFQAMNTGHTTYSTMHAGSVQAVINRLLNEPINVPIMMLQALNVVMVQAMSFNEGRKLRRCKYLVEITNVDQRTGNLSINEVFTWSPYRDAYEHKTDSFVLSQIMQSKGWTAEQLQAELANRARVISYLVKKDVHRYADVAPIIEAYYRNPQWVLEQLGSGGL